MKLYRKLRWIMLAVTVVVLILAFTAPDRIAKKQDPQVTAAQAKSFQTKLAEIELARAAGQSTGEVHLTSSEVTAAFTQAASDPQLVAKAVEDAGIAAPEQAPVKDMQVSFEGEVVRGQFLTELYGKDVWVTVAGRLASNQGYVTFAPTEFKIGSVSMPVSLVDPALQKKLAEPDTREKLKLPDFIGSLRVENGELVIVEK